jgi:hypothetical protein
VARFLHDVALHGRHHSFRRRGPLDFGDVVCAAVFGSTANTS